MKKKIIKLVGILAACACIAVLVLDPIDLLPGYDSPTNNNTNNTSQVDHTWVGPGKIYVGSCSPEDFTCTPVPYSPGTSAEYTLQIHNGNNVSANFSVGYRVPDFVAEGYSRPTSEARDWVWISNRKVLIGAHQTISVTISLGMPSTATPPGNKWEFWIGVIDQSQTGMVQVELGQRWLVTMA